MRKPGNKDVTSAILRLPRMDMLGSVAKHFQHEGRAQSLEKSFVGLGTEEDMINLRLGRKGEGRDQDGGAE